MLNLRYPFIMAPVKLGYSDASGEVNHKHLKFYMDRSAHMGALTLEPLFLDKGLREIPTQLGIDSDDKISGLRTLTDAIHQKGAKVIAHLNHPGRMANPKMPGNYYVSATDKACENGGAVPKRMDQADMKSIIDLFTAAAHRSEEAGFDIIELQMGHGYLLAQFLSPDVNDRTDEFGGSFENRLRFPLMIFEAVKKTVHLPIIVRVSGTEMTPHGILINETIALAKILEGKGAAAIHVSAGTVCSTPPWFFQHMFVPKGKTWELAADVKKELNIPVIFVGRINSIRDVDRLKNEFGAKYMALGRALVADPEFAGKYLQEIDGRIRPCLACSEGCLGGVRSGNGLGCVVNPALGNGVAVMTEAVEKKHFAVVGAGLAGLEAALTLKSRGHMVTLYEKNEIGGQFNLAWRPPNKESLKEIVDFYEYELKDKNIHFVNKEATESELLDKKFEAVIIATGAVPAVPPVKGLTKFFWTEFLHDENLPVNKTILIIGGGLIGMEVASKLVDKKNNVIIVEMLEEAARGMEMIEKNMTMSKLSMKNVRIYTETRVIEVVGDRVVLAGKHEQILENIDHIVVATGMTSYHPLYDSLKDKLTVHLIGDAKKTGKAQDAIQDGYKLALEL
ncbi:MAG: FAD-dependent oxidoreductase [Calditrichaceae bacterium]